MLNAIPMPAEEAKADVLAMFSDQGPAHINCAQAVLRFVLLVTGSDPELTALARQFGGGIAGTGETCGALTGAALALSLRDYQAAEAAGPAASRRALQESAQRFAAEFGALQCRDLTGFDLGTPEGHEAFVKSGGSDKCRVYVGWMCDQMLPLVESTT
jgi:C_GCAxxG_C_C family probable redox protein